MASPSKAGRGVGNLTPRSKIPVSNTKNIKRDYIKSEKLVPKSTVYKSPTKRNSPHSRDKKENFSTRKTKSSSPRKKLETKFDLKENSSKLTSQAEGYTSIETSEENGSLDQPLTTINNQKPAFYEQKEGISQHQSTNQPETVINYDDRQSTSHEQKELVSTECTLTDHPETITNDDDRQSTSNVRKELLSTECLSTVHLETDKELNIIEFSESRPKQEGVNYLLEKLEVLIKSLLVARKSLRYCIYTTKKKTDFAYKLDIQNDKTEVDETDKFMNREVQKDLQESVEQLKTCQRRMDDLYPTRKDVSSSVKPISMEEFQRRKGFDKEFNEIVKYLNCFSDKIDVETVFATDSEPMMECIELLCKVNATCNDAENEKRINELKDSMKITVQKILDGGQKSQDFIEVGTPETRTVSDVRTSVGELEGKIEKPVETVDIPEVKETENEIEIKGSECVLDIETETALHPLVIDDTEAKELIWKIRLKAALAAKISEGKVNHNKGVKSYEKTSCGKTSTPLEVTEEHAVRSRLKEDDGNNQGKDSSNVNFESNALKKEQIVQLMSEDASRTSQAIQGDETIGNYSNLAISTSSEGELKQGCFSEESKDPLLDCSFHDVTDFIDEEEVRKFGPLGKTYKFTENYRLPKTQGSHIDRITAKELNFCLNKIDEEMQKVLDAVDRTISLAQKGPAKILTRRMQTAEFFRLRIDGIRHRVNSIRKDMKEDIAVYGLLEVPQKEPSEPYPWYPNWRADAPGKDYACRSLYFLRESIKLLNKNFIDEGHLTKDSLKFRSEVDVLHTMLVAMSEILKTLGMYDSGLSLEESVIEESEAKWIQINIEERETRREYLEKMIEQLDEKISDLEDNGQKLLKIYIQKAKFLQKKLTISFAHDELEGMES